MVSALDRIRWVLYCGTTPSDKVVLTGCDQDYGCLTILLQDDVGGLQVQGMDGVWIVSLPKMLVVSQH